jgi:hypothetical protein
MCVSCSSCHSSFSNCGFCGCQFSLNFRNELIPSSKKETFKPKKSVTDPNVAKKSVGKSIALKTVSRIPDLVKRFAQLLDHAYELQLQQILWDRCSRGSKVKEYNALSQHRSQVAVKQWSRVGELDHHEPHDFKKRALIEVDRTFKRMKRDMSASRLSTPFEWMTDHGSEAFAIKSYTGFDLLRDFETIRIWGTAIAEPTTASSARSIAAATSASQVVIGRRDVRQVRSSKRVNQDQVTALIDTTASTLEELLEALRQEVQQETSVGGRGDEFALALA